MASDTGHARRFRKFWTLVFSMLAVAIGVPTGPAAAQTAETGISGAPEVIDADILAFGTQRVILWGIDAPEQQQTCQMNDTAWGCFDAAKRQLQLLAGRGEVSCVYKGEPDPFGRRYGICTSGGQDINAEMVKAGLALAFEEQSDEYLAQMADAITAGVGLWQVGVNFVEPWEFRRQMTPGGYR